MNGGKGRQETASGPKRMGEKHRGVNEDDKNRNGNGRNSQRRDDRNTRSDNGEGTVKTRADSETKKRLRIGSHGTNMGSPRKNEK